MQVVYTNCVYFAFLNIIQVTPAKGAYTLQVEVFSYSNPEHRDFEGACCDFAIIGCGKCESDFRFCVRSYGTSATTNSCPTSSVYYTSGPIPGSPSSYNFNTQGEIYPGANVNNPLVFTGDSWPVSLVVRESRFHYVDIYKNDGDT